MIRNLDLALGIHARLSVREFYVSDAVFRDVLAKSRRDGRRQFLRLNAAYNSLLFRFTNKVIWRGIVFVNASNVRIYEEEEPVLVTS